MEEEPCHKKPKFDDSLGDYKVIENYIEYIHTATNNVKAVVSDDLRDHVETITMYGGNIKQRKDISKTIKLLNEKLPLTSFQHLKRVRNETVLVCPTDSVKEKSIQEYVCKFVPELTDLFENFIEVAVPKHPVKLKKQHAVFNKIWSCNFHPDVYLEKLTSNNFFSEKELQTHKFYMTLNLEIALWYFKTSNLDVVTEDVFACLNVAIVVDPSIDSIVAVGIDNSSSHPIQHATMVSIDNVAKTQKGGAWIDRAKETDGSYIHNGVDKKLLNYLLKKFPVIKIGAKKYLSKTDLIDDEKTTSDGPYLCTNYYVYVLREPCIMCAMALVHSRAKRVFFCFERPETGALKSKLKLHTVSSLNHHYEVFTGFV
ncbi:unnamed protein product [Chilo suppressalis]|uniref:CMP/dCMP-type deaminase domain-containing protein n=1 Tax=Chilo suppressalis TaxID=168631 RepID=A0ABN8BBX9_CHISP|nr:unnamed protein product [Chilo suppressalis]CAH0688379.1 unnamed protein product [Chilo suppressalis]